jgi:hypothetical protein
MTNDESRTNDDWILPNFIFTTRSWLLLILSLSLILHPTVSRLVCLEIKHPSGAYDQIFITVRQMRVCWCGALSLTRGRVCRLQLLLALVSTVFRFRVPWDFLLSQIGDFHFRRLLRIAGLRWRYSTPPPHGYVCQSLVWPVFISSGEPDRTHRLQGFHHCCSCMRCVGNIINSMATIASRCLAMNVYSC